MFSFFCRTFLVILGDFANVYRYSLLVMVKICSEAIEKYVIVKEINSPRIENYL